MHTYILYVYWPSISNYKHVKDIRIWGYVDYILNFSNVLKKYDDHDHEYDPVDNNSYNSQKYMYIYKQLTTYLKGFRSYDHRLMNSAANLWIKLILIVRLQILQICIM
jgi:hypothetical protein